MQHFYFIFFADSEFWVNIPLSQSFVRDTCWPNIPAGAWTRRGCYVASRFAFAIQLQSSSRCSLEGTTGENRLLSLMGPAGVEGVNPISRPYRPALESYLICNDRNVWFQMRVSVFSKIVHTRDALVRKQTAGGENVDTWIQGCGRGLTWLL